MKGASIYSYPWRMVNRIPNAIVIIIEIDRFKWLFFNKAWWAHVIEIPDDNKITVFSNGICKGSNGWIPCGGHCAPISILGANLLWKKAQKNETKKNTSEVMNKIIPHFILLVTLVEWCPWNVLSRITSRHHWIIVRINVVNPTNKRVLSKKWNHLQIPEVRNRAPRAPVKGHGLTFTKWYGWFCVNIISFSWI